MLNNTENREIWYKEAELNELKFIELYGNKLQVIINPSKEINKFAPDLYILKNFTSADLKILKEPFYKSNELFNIPPEYCWTFNPSDFFEYAIKFPDNFGLFIWQSFKESSKFNIKINEVNKIYFCYLFELKNIINKSNKLHHYIKRMNDTNGNSYGSYAIDLRLIKEIKI